MAGLPEVFLICISGTSLHPVLLIQGHKTIVIGQPGFLMVYNNTFIGALRWTCALMIQNICLAQWVGSAIKNLHTCQ